MSYQEKDRSNPRIRTYPIRIASFALGKEQDIYIPEDAGTAARLFSEVLTCAPLQKPLEELLRECSRITGLYAIALGLDDSLPSGLMHLDITYFADFRRNDPNGVFKAIRDAENSLREAEINRNWRENGQASRGIGGKVSYGTYFVPCNEETSKRAILRYREGRMGEIIPLHSEPLQGVVILRNSRK